MDYFIRSEKKRNFSLEESGVTIAVANFPSWAKTEANIQLGQITYLFKKKKWYSQKYLIIRNRIPIGEISSNWKGHLFFKLQAAAAKTADYVPSNMDIDASAVDWRGKEVITYTMKHKGFFKNRLEIFQNKDPRSILTMHAEKDWFKVNYRIELHYLDSIHFPIEELLGLFGFGAVLVRMRRAAAAS